MLRCCFVDEVISVFVILAPAYFHKQWVGTKEKNVAIFKEYSFFIFMSEIVGIKSDNLFGKLSHRSGALKVWVLGFKENNLVIEFKLF